MDYLGMMVEDGRGRMARSSRSLPISHSPINQTQVTPEEILAGTQVDLRPRVGRDLSVHALLEGHPKVNRLVGARKKGWGVSDRGGWKEMRPPHPNAYPHTLTTPLHQRTSNNTHRWPSTPPSLLYRTASCTNTGPSTRSRTAGSSWAGWRATTR